MPRWLAANNELFRRAAKVAIFILPALLIGLTLPGALHAQGPALTTISGTVYRADGTAAAGTVLISWPSFQTAEGDAVAAGNLAVTIGPLGAFTAQLVPNVGATPAGTYYVAVRYSDVGWGAGYNGNLVGRFTSTSFTLTRYARAQDYFLRSYDNSTPPKYSRYSAGLHVDYPLT
ncbi:MAG: hypothetical protein ACLPVW_07065 [Terriglobales bacterium]